MNCDVRVNGGWGWVIVACFALSNFLRSAMMRLFGILFAALVEEFNESASYTSFAFGLRLCLTTLTVPFAVYFADRFSERPVIMLGGLIYCLSYALILPAPSLSYVVVFVGINDIGTGLVLPSYQAVVGKYFSKRTSLSSMLGYAGSSLGQITLPHLILYLVREYGLRGMLMIYGGVMFHITAFGALVRPLPSVTKDTDYIGRRMPVSKFKISSSGDLVQSSELEICLTPKNELPSETKTNDEMKYQRNIQTSTGSLVLTSKSSVADEAEFADECSGTTNEEHKKHMPISTRVKNVLLNVFDTTLIRDARFCLFILSSGLSSACFLGQITYLVPWSTEQGHSLDRAALLLPIAGGAEFIGRIIMGLLGDWKPIGPIKVMIIYACLIGTGNILVGFASAYSGMVAYAVAFGLWGSGGHLSVVPIIGSMFDRTKISSAVGINLAAQGPISAGFIVLMGLIKDTTGSYQTIFFAYAAVQYIIAILMITTLCLHRRRRGRNDDDGMADSAVATELVIIENESKA